MAASEKIGNRIGDAIRNAKAQGNPAIIPYITAGFPKRETFREQLAAVAAAEIGRAHV